MSSTPDPPRMVTLADLKDAIEYLALGQLSLSVAVQMLMTEEIEKVIGPDRMEFLRKNQLETAKNANKVFEKLFALEPAV